MLTLLGETWSNCVLYFVKYNRPLFYVLRNVYTPAFGMCQHIELISKYLQQIFHLVVGIASVNALLLHVETPAYVIILYTYVIFVCIWHICKLRTRFRYSAKMKLASVCASSAHTNL